MSSHDNEKSPSTLQPMVIILGILLAAVVVYGLLKATPVEEVVVAPAVAAKVEENIKPVAVAEVAPVAVASAERTGAEIVQAACAACHVSGMLNAPMIGNKEQWAPRIAQGYATLTKHAIEGIRSMPARGGNSALTDDEVANAVAEMANGAGADFKFVKTAN